ncbi:MAG: hypothetical protein IJ793_00460 [Opitutales bacterium]|nr:hypothetical protein [Opitutales bacterium]
MRNKTKTLFIGGAFACIGSLSGHGGTFQEKLDAYFAEHAQEIQESIQAWDKYNLYKPEYRITEQELKDIVLRSREKVIRYLCLSLKHQIRFFWYYTQHMYACKKAAELKKRFDAEQVREYASQELDDMQKQFELRGISYPKLTKYHEACDLAEKCPCTLKDKIRLCAGRDDDDVIAGGRKWYERTVDDMYAIERVEHFFRYILDIRNGLYEGFYSLTIEIMFGNGFCTYTKWNPNAYPGWKEREYQVVRHHGRWSLTTPIIQPQSRWYCPSLSYSGADGILRVKSYPGFCFDASSKQLEDVKKLFLLEDLVQTYLKVVKCLPEFIEVACHLYQAYAETKFLAEGKKKSTTFAWDDWRLKRAALLMALETDFCFIKDLLCKHEAFHPIVDDLNRIWKALEALCPKSDNKPSKETFGENKRLSEFKK